MQPKMNRCQCSSSMGCPASGPLTCRQYVKKSNTRSANSGLNTKGNSSVPCRSRSRKWRSHANRTQRPATIRPSTTALAYSVVASTATDVAVGMAKLLLEWVDGLLLLPRDGQGSPARRVKSQPRRQFGDDGGIFRRHQHRGVLHGPPGADNHNAFPLDDLCRLAMADQCVAVHR